MKAENKPTFKKKNIFQRAFMPLEELETYYREKRKYEQDKEIKHIGIRKCFYPIMVFILFIRRIFAKQKIVIVSDKRKRNKNAKIYTFTHVGGDDGVIFYEACKDHCYWFFGDFGGCYKKIDGLLVYLNGMICLDTWDKTDRQIARNNAIKLLKKGGNLQMTPEGSWNITENKPVMHCYTGAVEMSIESGADIIPVAIEQYGKTFYVNFGENISSEHMTLENKREHTAELRDAMSTLKWEIWEKYGRISRADLPDNASEQWMQYIQGMCDAVDFPMEDVVRTIYKDKNDVIMQEVQDIQKHLIPCRENAFLFNKRLK